MFFFVSDLHPEEEKAGKISNVVPAGQATAGAEAGKECIILVFWWVLLVTGARLPFCFSARDDATWILRQNRAVKEWPRDYGREEEAQEEG